MEERYLTTKEVAELLGVIEKTVRAWIRDGELAAIMLGRKSGYRVRNSELERFVRAREAVIGARAVLRGAGEGLRGKTDAHTPMRAAA